MDSTLRVAVVGLGFGAEFVPIYLHHPSISSVVLCDVDGTIARSVAERYRIEEWTGSFETILADDSIDAVHLVSPIPAHADQSVAVLDAGKHCACTVPMATTIADIERIVEAQARAERKYMMMETAVYTREFLEARRLLEEGTIGRIQLLRGAHYQDMERWPEYWYGLPPMHYATHAIAPLLTLSQTRAERVTCFGSGEMRDELHEQYGNPYPVETALFRLVPRRSPAQPVDARSSATPNVADPIAAEVTRSLFHTARAYTESFNVYGELATFEWQQIEEEPPVLFVMKGQAEGRTTTVATRRLECADRVELLPEPIRRFTRRGVYDETDAHRSFLQGGGHGGSHPHLVHEFVSAVLDDREPTVGAVRAAEITAAGICAHESAMDGGRSVDVPVFGQDCG